LPTEETELAAKSTTASPPPLQRHQSMLAFLGPFGSLLGGNTQHPRTTLEVDVGHRSAKDQMGDSVELPGQSAAAEPEMSASATDKLHAPTAVMTDSQATDQVDATFGVTSNPVNVGTGAAPVDQASLEAEDELAKPKGKTLKKRKKRTASNNGPAQAQGLPSRDQSEAGSRTATPEPQQTLTAISSAFTFVPPHKPDVVASDGLSDATSPDELGKGKTPESPTVFMGGKSPTDAKPAVPSDASTQALGSDGTPEPSASLSEISPIAKKILESKANGNSHLVKAPTLRRMPHRRVMSSKAAEQAFAASESGSGTDGSSSPLRITDMSNAADGKPSVYYLYMPNVDSKGEAQSQAMEKAKKMLEDENAAK